MTYTESFSYLPEQESPPESRRNHRLAVHRELPITVTGSSFGPKPALIGSTLLVRVVVSVGWFTVGHITVYSKTIPVLRAHAVALVRTIASVNGALWTGLYVRHQMVKCWGVCTLQRQGRHDRRWSYR